MTGTPMYRGRRLVISAEKTRHATAQKCQTCAEVDVSLCQKDEEMPRRTNAKDVPGRYATGRRFPIFVER